MLDSPPKRMAVLAAVSFVLIASLLMFNTSDNDGEGSDDTTGDWSQANAVIFTRGQPAGTYYKTIQGAVKAAEADAEETGISSVTIYVKEQTITKSISVGYVQTNVDHGLLEITIKGIGTSQPIKEPKDSTPVTLTKGKQLEDPVFRVEGRLILKGITIMNESATVSNGDESQSAPAIEVVSTIPNIRNGELELLSSDIGSESQQYPGVAIDVSGGSVHIDENSKLYSVVSSDQGVITARSSAVYVYGSVFGNPAGDGYEIYTMCEDVVRSNSGIGLTIYVKDMTSEIDVRLGVPEGPRVNNLSIEYAKESGQQGVSYQNIIDVTLQDGFPLGTNIVFSKVGSDVICSEMDFGWSSSNDYCYCYLVTLCSEDDPSITIKDEGMPVLGKLITFADGDEVVFAGITDNLGSVSYPSDLSGLYGLSIGDNLRGSVGLDPGSDGSVEAGPVITTTGDILVRSVTTKSSESGPEGSNSINSEITNTPPIISGSLSSRQTIWESYNIIVGDDILSLVFSLKLPSDIDTDRVILFREHAGTAAEMDFVSASGFWGRGDDCFTVESIGGTDYITIRSSQFSVFSVGEEEPVPPERTVVTAVIEDRQVRISVGPESYKEYSVHDSDGNVLLGWQSGASGLTIRFDLLPPGAEYRVMGRYIGTTSEILEATIVAPKDPVIEVVAAGVDSVVLSSEDMVEYRLLSEDGTPVGDWVPGDGTDKAWDGLDPILDYYAEATSTSDGMTLSTGPVLVKAGVSSEVTGVMKHGGAYLVVSGIGQGWTCTADAEVYHSSGTSVTFGPLTPGTVVLTFTPSDGGEPRKMEVLVPPVPQDSEDDAEVVTIDSREDVMYRLHDHTGAVVSDGWTDGGGGISWSVDPSKGYFVTMVTGNEDGAVLFPMVEVKRPAEMLASAEAA